MDRERQTLELLQLLGDEVAEAVLGRLQPERAEKLRAGMKADSRLVSTIGRQREVLDEFECFFQFALRSMPPESMSSAELGENTEDPSLSESGVYKRDPVDESTSDSRDSDLSSSRFSEEVSEQHTSGDSIARKASTSESDSEGNSSSTLQQHSSENDAGNSNTEQEDLMAVVQASSAQKLPGDPLRDLQTLSIHQLANALVSEQSRTTAILLSKLPAKLTGDILNLLKPDYQKLVMQELTKEQHAPAVLVERIARATFFRAQQLPSDPPDTQDHADRVAEVLRNVPKAGRRNMLAAIEEQDPELAKSLLTRIYRFDDLTALNKTVVQRVLGEVDSTNLTTALFGAPEAVKEAIFANLSKRARQTIEEEMQFMTNVAESRIQQARNSIAEIIAKIDMEGEP